MLGMVRRKAFYRNPLGTTLAVLSVAGIGGAISNSIAWRLYEGPMVE
jgi:hypothetical protein